MHAGQELWLSCYLALLTIDKRPGNKKSAVPWRAAYRFNRTYKISLIFMHICLNYLTHWGRDKMAAFFQTTFSNGFSSIKIYGFRLGFHWSLFLGLELMIFKHWFRQWLGASQAISNYLNQWWLVYWCIYASLSLNELKCGENQIRLGNETATIYYLI